MTAIHWKGRLENALYLISLKKCLDAARISESYFIFLLYFQKYQRCENS